MIRFYRKLNYYLDLWGRIPIFVNQTIRYLVSNTSLTRAIVRRHFHATFFSLYPATEIISSSLAASTFSFSKGFRYVSVTLIEKWPNALLMMPILIPAWKANVAHVWRATYELSFTPGSNRDAIFPVSDWSHEEPEDNPYTVLYPFHLPGPFLLTLLFV